MNRSFTPPRPWNHGTLTRLPPGTTHARSMGRSSANATSGRARTTHAKATPVARSRLTRASSAIFRARYRERCFRTVATASRRRDAATEFGAIPRAPVDDETTGCGPFTRASSAATHALGVGVGAVGMTSTWSRSCSRRTRSSAAATEEGGIDDDGATIASSSPKSALDRARRRRIPSMAFSAPFSVLLPAAAASSSSSSSTAKNRDTRCPLRRSGAMTCVAAPQCVAFTSRTLPTRRIATGADAGSASQCSPAKTYRASSTAT
eukprot:1810-Pelagococcus_subviridis.AAC.4